MATLLLKKSYRHKDLKEIKFNDLWNSYGVFTTMRVIGKPTKILFFKQQDHEKDLKNVLSTFYKNSNFYFFDYGRTAFYEILNQIKTKTSKRKILVNSLTLFEIINVIIYLIN